MDETYLLMQTIGIEGLKLLIGGMVNKFGEDFSDIVTERVNKSTLLARWFKKPETQAALVEAQTALAALPEAPTEAQQEAALAPLNQQITNEAASNPEFADEWQKLLAELKALHEAKSGRTDLNFHIEQQKAEKIINIVGGKNTISIT